MLHYSFLIGVDLISAQTIVRLVCSFNNIIHLIDSPLIILYTNLNKLKLGIVDQTHPYLISHVNFTFIITPLV